MSELRLTSIRASATVPVYEVVNKERLCSFSSPDLEIWSPTANKTIPFIVSRSNATLQLTFSNAGANSSSYTYGWELIADDGPVSYPQGGIGCSCNPESGTQTVTFRLGVFSQNAFPVGFKGSIKWTVSGGASANFPYIVSTPLEFYVLPDNLPKFISDSLPVQLLRVLLLSSFSQPQNSPCDWVSFITNFLRTHNFRYETIGGTYNYCDYPDQGVDNIKTTCYLERWMEHFKSMEGLKPGVAPQFQRRVNCYDLATLAQVMIALGVDSKQATLRMKFLSPFGYIEKTSLIGFPSQETNSPFFAEAEPGWNPNPMAKPTDTLIRSKFRDHAFLTIDTGSGEMAVDATCGPDNGKRTLQEYINKAIDHKTKDPRNANYRSGTIDDLRDGPGVTDIQSLVDLPEFPFSPSTVGHPNEGIVQAMYAGVDRKELPAGKIAPPTYTVNGTSLNLHWNFHLENNDTISTIEMVFISSGGKLQNLEYLHRLAYLQAGCPAAPVDLFEKTSATDDSYWRGVIGVLEGNQPSALWYHASAKSPDGSSTTGFGVVVAMKGFKDTATLTQAATAVRGYVNNEVKLNQAGETPSDVSIRSYPNGGTSSNVSQGTEFVVEAVCTGDAVQFIGANVETEKGNALYLGAETQPGTIRFRFYARSAGEETITFSFYKTHLTTKAFKYVTTIR